MYMIAYYKYELNMYACTLCTVCTLLIRRLRLHFFVRSPRGPSTKCPRDETAGDEVSLQQNERRQNGGNETGCTPQ